MVLVKGNRIDNYEMNIYEHAINMTAIRKHVAFLTSLGSRVTGYLGYKKATEYIIHYFNKLGIKTIIQEFNTTVPIDVNSYIELMWPNDTKTVIKAYALWPNFIQACAIPKGIEGKLVYVGKGEFSDLNGKDLNGSIVLMDFTSGSNWLRVADFGAKAIIFLSSEPITKYEALSKFSMTPIYVPRLYVPPKDAKILLKFASTNGNVRVYSDIAYRRVIAKNIIGVINGTKYPDEIIILSAHYDTWSIVPRIAPGASDSLGLAFLLELARYYASHRPLRTLWLVAYGGHWEGLTGAREFVEKYYFSRSVMMDKQKILLQIGLDITSDSEGVTLLYVGHFYKCGAYGGSGAIESRYAPVLSTMEKEVLPKLQKLGISKDLLFIAFKSIYWTGTEPEPYILDTEPATLSGSLAFTIMTSYSRKIWWGSPYDLMCNVDFEKLSKQFIIVSTITDFYLYNDNIGITWDRIKPNRLRIVGGDFKSYITFRGKVIYYDLESGWYKPIGREAIVRVGIHPNRYYPFANILLTTDKRGYFEVHGMPVSSVLPQYIYIDAWVVNGNAILFAPDMGIYGAKSFATTFTPLAHPFNVTIVVFPCAMIELFDIYDPLTGERGVIPDPTRSGDLYYFLSMSRIVPYDFESLAEPISYGYFYRPMDPLAIIFAKPGSRIGIVFQTGMIKLEHAGIIINASPVCPEGSGLFLKEQGERIRISFTAYHFARDLFLVSKHRSEILTSHYVGSLTLKYSLFKTSEYLNKTIESLHKKDYSKAYSLALTAWAWALRSYRDHVMPLIHDLSITTVFYFSLIIPFIVFFERLVFHAYGKRRFLVILITAIVLVTIFGKIHPAFTLVSNSALSLSGIVVLVFLAFVLSIFISETSSIMAREAERRLGKHRIAVTFAPFIHFSSSAIESMRRYKLRTILTMLTIVVVMIATLSLTSSSYYLAVLAKPLSQKPPYTGLLIKRSYGTPPSNSFDLYTPLLISGIVQDKGIVAPRYWLYPSMLYPYGLITFIVGKSYNATYPIRAFFGISPADAEHIIHRALVVGRVFTEEDYMACILSRKQSKVLGVSIGDTIQWNGLRLKVIGIYDPQTLVGFKDLDGLGITPIDPSTIPQYVPPGKKVPQVQYPLAWDLVLLIPWRLARDLGGYVASVAVYFNETLNEEEMENLASEVAEILGNTILGLGGRTVSYTGIISWALLGWGVIIVILALGALNVLIALIAALRERRRDIYVYTAVGLSPRGTATMFITESFAYAVVASVLGYLAGIGLNLLLHKLGLLPTIYIVNYSSLSAVLSILVTIGIVLASTIYPISVAARMITPSLERKWKPTTRPKGDVWEIPLPIAVATSDEALGILYYLNEYLLGAGKATRYFTVLSVDGISIDNRSISFNVLLAPREMNVTQNVRITFALKENRYTAILSIRRLSGDYVTWRSSNYNFIDSMRKQLLLWRSLSKGERSKYIKYFKHK